MTTVLDKLTVKLELVSPEIQQIREAVRELQQWVADTPLGAIQEAVDWCISAGHADAVMEIAEWLQRQV